MLRRCPFCNNEAHIYKTYCIIPALDEWWIKCGSCGASFGRFTSEDKAVKAWNKRALQDSSIKEDLEKILARIS